MSVTTLGSVVDGFRKVADVDIEGVNGLHVRLQKAIFGEIVAASSDAPPTADDVVDMDHLKDIQFPAFPAGPSEDEGEIGIGVIISAELAGLWLNGERRVGAKGLPVGLKSDLGWGLIGPRDIVDANFCCHFISSHEQQDEISCNVEKMLARDFESVEEEKEAMSLEDKFALRQMEESIRWDEKVQRYRVGLPWKDGREAAAAQINDLDSGRMALDRLERLGRKLSRDPERCKVTFETMAKFDE